MSHQEYNHFPSADVLFLDRGDGNSALVHLHGATILSWKTQGKEQLYLSSTAKFDKKKAIRGGIPLVFPNFGPWPLGPQHGFARIKGWTVAVPANKDSHGNVIAVLSLEDDEETRQMWNHKFKLIYTLELREKELVSTFVVQNKGSEAFDFTCLLHSYFRVADINKTGVTGLKGLVYSDKLKNDQTETENRETVTVGENVDRTYMHAPNQVLISSEGDSPRKVELHTFNLPDIVVWNPWDQKAREMSDFDDQGYREMICVEAGKVATPVTLQAGGRYECSQTFKALL